MMWNYILSLVLFTAIISKNWALEPVNGYYAWSARGSLRTELYCPESCKTEEHVDRCCSCHAAPCWEILPLPSHCNVTFGLVDLEYVGVGGTAMIQRHPNDLNVTYHRLIHISGKLSQLPQNVCSFPNLKEINVQSNSIQSIESLSCVKELEILDISYNKLTSIPNDTFADLKKIRILNLNNNYIEKLDPNTLQISSGQIFNVDLAYNYLYEIDITNLLTPGSFCLRNLSNTQNEEILNMANFAINTSQIYGPGDIDCVNTSIATSVNVSNYNIDIADTAWYIKGSWIIGGTYEFACDCGVAGLIEAVGYNVIKFYWKQYGNVTCSSPNTIRGYSVGTVVERNLMDQMTCELTAFCPDGCRCTDMQFLEKVMVNCTNAGFTKFPDYMPVGAWNNSNLHLILDNNNIQNLENTEYLDRVSSLSLPGNVLTHLDADAVARLPNTAVIDISDSMVSELPAILQRLNPNLIKFGPALLSCDCNNTWISVWLQNYGAFDKLMCAVDGQAVKAELVTYDYLECAVDAGVPTGVTLAIIFSSVGGSILLVLGIHFLRYEIMIMRRRVWHAWKKNIYKTQSNLDLFVSFDDEDDSPSMNKRPNKMNLCEWSMSILRPRLKLEGLTSFIPFIDMAIGTDANRYDQTIEAISDSATYLILYTDSYSKRAETITQFRYLWKSFTKYSHKTIIVINFDGTPISLVGSRKMRALMRAGIFLDYSFTELNMIDRLMLRLPRTRTQTINMKLEDDFNDETGSQLKDSEVSIIGDTDIFEEDSVDFEEHLYINEDTLSIVRRNDNEHVAIESDICIPNAINVDIDLRNQHATWHCRSKMTKTRKNPVVKHDSIGDNEANGAANVDVKAELQKIYGREMYQRPEEKWKMYDTSKYAYSYQRTKLSRSRWS